SALESHVAIGAGQGEAAVAHRAGEGLRVVVPATQAPVLEVLARMHVTPVQDRNVDLRQLRLRGDRRVRAIRRSAARALRAPISRDGVDDEPAGVGPPAPGDPVSGQVTGHFIEWVELDGARVMPSRGGDIQCPADYSSIGWWVPVKRVVAASLSALLAGAAIAPGAAAQSSSEKPSSTTSARTGASSPGESATKSSTEKSSSAKTSTATTSATTSSPTTSSSKPSTARKPVRRDNLPIPALDDGEFDVDYATQLSYVHIPTGFRADSENAD